MNNTFRFNTGVSSTTISGWNTSNVTSMMGMFAQCTMDTLDISHFNTSKVTTMLDMFYRCSNLVTLTLGNYKVPTHTYFDTSSVTNFNSMFESCSNLENIMVEYKADWSVGSSATSAAMFSGCSKLPN